MKEQGCLMWEKGRVKAPEGQTKMGNRCPMESVCEGSRCIYLDESKKKDKQTEKPNKGTDAY